MKSPLKEDICNCIGHVIKEKEKKGQKPKDAKVFFARQERCKCNEYGRADKFPSAGSVKFIVHPWSFEKQTYMARQVNINFFISFNLFFIFTFHGFRKENQKDEVLSLSKFLSRSPQSEIPTL